MKNGVKQLRRAHFSCAVEGTHRAGRCRVPFFRSFLGKQERTKAWFYFNSKWRRDDGMDAGDRATHGAVAERDYSERPAPHPYEAIASDVQFLLLQNCSSRHPIPHQIKHRGFSSLFVAIKKEGPLMWPLFFYSGGERGIRTLDRFKPIHP